MTEDMNETAVVETNIMPPHQVDQFVKITATIKRRLEEDTPVPPKKVCGLFSLQEVAEDGRPPSTLEDPLLLPIEACNLQTKTNLNNDENKENFVGTENPNFDSILAKTLLAARDKGLVDLDQDGNQPKVIVEHQPLPSIYELGHVTRDLDNTALREEGTESDDSQDSDEDSSMFEAPPINTFPSPKNQTSPPHSPSCFPGNPWIGPNPLPVSTPSGPLTPPPSPVPSTLQPTTTTVSSPCNSTYQFLDQSNQRIECDENGKSYLQLGTVNHHLPVTPVLQPKPTTLTPRRPPALHFRPAPPIPMRQGNSAPPCDHSACLSRRSSPCYRQQRSRMLNMSLHKLHLARQRADSNLCRSVLICNMLRHIEEESEREQREQEATFNQRHAESQHGSDSPYWNGINSQNTINSFSNPPPTPNPYRTDNSYNNTSTTPNTESSFEPPLKDFNSAFRQTPLPPIPTSDSSNGQDEERGGINWSSVLSLSSQSDLDPLNNNAFSADPSGWTPLGSDPSLTDVDLSQTSFDDINWKLTPVSADDVLKAFPNDENIFQCSA